MDMNVFLKVDENDVKLATKAKFWKEATPEMWAIDPKLIWDFMRINGWIQNDINIASMARSNQTPEVKARNQTPEVKARKKAQSQTPEAMARRQARRQKPKVKAKKAAQDKAWRQKPEVKARQQTPEAKAKKAAQDKARNQTPEVKAKKQAQRQSPEAKARRQTPEAKAKRNSRRRQRRKTDPEFKLLNNLRNNFKRIKKFLIEANVMTEKEVKQFKQNCKDNDSYYAQHFRHYLEKTLPDGVTWMDWTANKTDLHIDHVFPLMPAINNSKLFLGLLEFVQNPANVMFLDMATNKSKSDKIILELIPQNCPGYPFAGIDAEVCATVEDAGLPRAPFEKWLEIKKILETFEFPY